jgi:hypothetical protein
LNFCVNFQQAPCLARSDRQTCRPGRSDFRFHALIWSDYLGFSHVRFRPFLPCPHYQLSIIHCPAPSTSRHTVTSLDNQQLAKARPVTCDGTTRHHPVTNPKALQIRGYPLASLSIINYQLSVIPRFQRTRRWPCAKYYTLSCFDSNASDDIQQTSKIFSAWAVFLPNAIILD